MAKVPKSIRAAEKANNAARESMVKAVQSAYPIGTLLLATLGRARVEGVVEGYGESWSSYSYGHLFIRNIRTGRRRTLYPTLEAHDIEIVAPAHCEPATKGQP